MAEPLAYGIGSAGAIQLLAPQAWADYVAANPSVPVVNVHVPYEGHIADSNKFAAFDTILDWAELPADKGAPLVLYCRSGNMSGQASEELVAAGYTNIIDLEGGMNAWTAEGLPLLTEQPAGAG